jgi:hypothetical protein
LVCYRPFAEIKPSAKHFPRKRLLQTTGIVSSGREETFLQKLASSAVSG